MLLSNIFASTQTQNILAVLPSVFSVSEQILEQFFSTQPTDQAIFKILNSCETLEQFLAVIEHKEIKPLVSWYKFERCSASSTCSYSAYSLTNHALDQKFHFCELTNKRVIKSINLVI